MTEFEIKTCPHCGGDANLYTNYSKKLHTHLTFCKCNLCGATGKTYTEDGHPADEDWNTDACYEAIRAWNKRV